MRARVAVVLGHAPEVGFLGDLDELHEKERELLGQAHSASVGQNRLRREPDRVVRREGQDEHAVAIDRVEEPRAEAASLVRVLESGRSGRPCLRNPAGAPRATRLSRPDLERKTAASEAGSEKSIATEGFTRILAVRGSATNRRFSSTRKRGYHRPVEGPTSSGR